MPSAQTYEYHFCPFTGFEARLLASNAVGDGDVSLCRCDVCVMTAGTFEQCVRAHVAEGEAND